MFLKVRQIILSHRIILRRLSSYSSPKMSTGESVGLDVNKVLSVLENFAPKALAETWDNIGLLVQPYTARDITKILLTNDLTEDVALEAVKQNCELIISYHPPIFAPMKSVVQSSWKEKIVSILLENRIYLYSPHTSWDCVRGGVNDWLASAFAPAASAPLVPNASQPDFGAGRLLQLEAKTTINDAVLKVKQLTGLKYVRLAIGKGKQLDDVIQTVALCAGSGASVLKGVKADLYLTGEMLHHDVLDAAQKGTSVILTNHSDSERGFLKTFSSHLETTLNNQVQIVISLLDKDPLDTV